MSNLAGYEVINRLYAAFADEPRPRRIDGCRCCVEDKGVAILLSTPLRELTPDDLSSYASSAFLTVGAEADFRFFLPRILDIAAADQGWWPDPEVIGRAMGEVRTWTEAQRNAVAAFLTEVVVTASKRENPSGYLIDQWLCAASHVMPGWDSLLRVVEANVQALVQLGLWHSEVNEGKLSNEFWNDSPKKDAMITWLRSEEVWRKRIVSSE